MEREKILLVDDSPGGLLALEAILEDLGERLVTARTGQEALDKLAAESFAAIILDIRLPDLDGFEVARRLRDLEHHRATPVIFVTAFDDQPTTAEQAYSLGAVDFLTKPVVPAILRAKVKALVDLRRMTQRLAKLERQQYQQQTDRELARLNQDLKRRIAEFETLFSALPVGIGLAGDRDCRQITVNPAFAEQLGVAPDSNASLTAPADERPTFKVLRNGQEVTPEQLPMQLAAREGKAVRGAEFDVIHADGRTVRLLEYAAPLFDEQQQPRGSVGIFVDITDRKKTEEQNARLLDEVLHKSRQLEVLSRGTKDVNTVLDPGAIMRTLVSTAMELVGALGGCAGLMIDGEMVFHEYNDQGRLIPIDIVFRDEDKHGIPSWVMRHGTHYLTNDAERDDVIRPDLREHFGIYNAVNMPVLSRQGELLGCFELHNTRDRRPFTTLDLAYLQGLAASAAVALDNAGLLERVRQADRRKDEFLAMLAHELRNPLAPMRNALELLRLRGNDPQISLSSRQVMDRQLRHMTRLIDDLLDVSRITRGRIELRCEQLDLAQLVRHSVEGHRPAAEAASLSLNLHVPQIPVWVHGDETRLAQIMDNLLGNSIKFSEAGGQLEVHLVHDRYRNDAAITVCDTGIGIAPQDLEHVFDSFSQADRSLDRKRGGLGLGLALVKGLAELHGGSISAASSGIGTGSTFTLHLPTLPEPAALVNSLPSFKPTTQALQILVIEDNRDAANTLCMLLRAFGYDATVAHSGPDGIDKARRLQPQVVLCDIGLPGMDGFAVARTLRHDPALSQTRLIAVTGYGREEDKTRALEAGFDEHITKPADADKLLATLAVIKQTPL